METMLELDTENTVSSMHALRAALLEDLEDLERRIHALKESPMATSENGKDEMKVYYVARAASYSGLASIDEVLRWIRLMAPRDAHGNVAAAVKGLPEVEIFSIH